jgi:hypothetical protein
MKTIEITLYKFEELSEAAQQKAINNYRDEGNNDSEYCYHEAHDTVKKFNDIFNTKYGHESWLDVRTSHIDDNTINLKGLRLRKYIINNYWSQLDKGKFFSLWSKTEKSYKHYKEGHPVLKKRYSKVLFDNSCVLTGVCYDHDILDPIYNLIEKYDPKQHDNLDMETLFEDCFYSLKKSLENEDQYRNSDEYIFEELTNSNHVFTENGEQY